MGKLGKLLESLIFHGLKPVDPLYLTNRSRKRKLLFGTLVAVPCVLLAGVLGLVLGGYFRKDMAFPAESRKTAVKLPAFDPKVVQPVDRDLEVMDIQIKHDGVIRVKGTVRNTSNRAIRSAEVVFDLIDSRGSRMGAVSAKVRAVEPHGSASFEFPIAQEHAVAAIVREINTQ